MCPLQQALWVVARRWLLQYFQKNVFIASQKRWSQLKDEQQTIKYLVEENGEYREEAQAPQTN